MANYVKYLLTVDADTGVPVKIEQVGEAGELREVSMSDLAPAISPGSAGGTVIVNIYAGGQVSMQQTPEQAARLLTPGIFMGGRPSTQK
ncbi:MAG: hypothetical protein HYU52_10715 [Acidobacteria bacterium]|nr:hypothetical protein [Acidobacteriota bacterium]